MSVRQLSNGKWIADRTVNGKRRTKTARTEKEAEYWDRKFEFEYGRYNLSDEELRMPGMPLSMFIEEVFWPKKPHLRSRTRYTYKRSIKNDILPALGDVPYNKITPALVQDMINSCSCRRTAEQARETLSSILSLAVDGIVYSVNPASVHFSYPPPLGIPSRKGVILSRYSAHKKLLEHVASHHPGEQVERQVVLGLCFGLRPEEVFGLDWENVSFEERSIYIDQVLVSEGGKHLEPPKTSKGKRVVPMTSYAYERMTTWWRSGRRVSNLHGDAAHPVVTNRFSDRADSKTGMRNLEKLRAEHYDDGSPIPHVTQWSMRHSYGTAAAVDAKMDVNLLRDLMGHEDSSTTRKYYIVPQLDDLHSAVGIIDSFF